MAILTQTKTHRDAFEKTSSEEGKGKSIYTIIKSCMERKTVNKVDWSDLQAPMARHRLRFN